MKERELAINMDEYYKHDLSTVKFGIKRSVNTKIEAIE
jgi:hypothetical protein